MEHLESYSQRRQENAANYDSLFADSGLDGLVTLPEKDSNCEHVWNQYTIRVNHPSLSRDDVRKELGELKVGSEIYYPVPLHQQECFKKLDYKAGDLPHTEAAAKSVLALPIFPELTLAEQQYVVQSLCTVLQATTGTLRRAA